MSKVRPFLRLPNGNWVEVSQVAAVELVGFATHVKMRSGVTVRASSQDVREALVRRLADAALWPPVDALVDRPETGE